MKKIIENIEVLDFAAEGKCLSKTDKKILFTKNTAPGDIIDVLVTRKRRSYLEGRPIRFHKESKLRVEPFCKHYNYCGGCQWQHVPYSEELKFKKNQIEDQLQRIGGLRGKAVSEILACDQDRYYRNKLEFSFASQRWLTPEELNKEGVDRGPGLGFHISGHYDKVLDIEECYLQENSSNKIRNRIREFALKNDISFYQLRKKEGTLRSLTLRNNRKGEWMIILQFGKKPDDSCFELLEMIKSEFPEIISIYYVVNTKVNDTFYDLETHLFYGDEVLFEKLNGLEFRIRPKSFFQVNTDQAEKLYNKAIEFCGDLSGKTIYDLYTGTGTIALSIAPQAGKVIGIDSVDQAIKDANWNAHHNNIDNAKFFCGDMREMLNEEFIKENGKPDIIITDPPRDGMHKDVIETLLKTGAKRIVYISCKPSTQARDLAILSEKYKVGSIQPVDMFPRTHHVENILQLNLK